VTDFVICWVAKHLMRVNFDSCTLFTSDMAIKTHKGPIRYHCNDMEFQAVTLKGKRSEHDDWLTIELKRPARSLDSGSSISMAFGHGVVDINITHALICPRAGAHGRCQRSARRALWRNREMTLR